MSKGGMCKNPFAGFTRPDKLDPKGFLGPHDPPEKAILLATLLDAFTNYAYFGLGDTAPDGSPRGNGTTAENFWFDYLYLFHVRSDRPETWEHARVMKETAIDEVTGKRKTRYIELTNDQLRMMCSDTHFSLLGWPFTFERFLEMVKEHRQVILTKDGAQIRTYIRMLREFSVANYAPGWSLPLFMSDSDVDMRILLEPRSAEEVEALVGYVPKYFKAKKERERRVPEFKREVLEAAEKQALKLAVDTSEGSLFHALEATA